MTPTEYTLFQYEAWIHATVRFYTDPVLKIVTPQPVFCPYGHVNDKRVLDLANAVEGYVRCNHRNCNTQIHHYVVDPSHAYYIEQWYNIWGGRFTLETFNEVVVEAEKRFHNLENATRPEPETIEIAFDQEPPPHFARNLILTVAVTLIYFYVLPYDMSS